MGKDCCADKTILITGAGGYLGGELLRRLYELTDFRLTALTSDKKKVLSGRSYDGKRLRCVDLEEWRQGGLVWDDVDVMIHCAFSRMSSGKELAESLIFTDALMKQAVSAGVAQIVNISSQGVYGGGKDPLCDETAYAAPRTLYAMSKFSAELLTDGICAMGGRSVSWTNIRLGSLIGTTDRSKFISKFVINALRGEPIKIIGGTQTFSLIDVRDAAAAIMALLSLDPAKWKRIYNLSNNRRCNIAEIAEKVRKTARKYNCGDVRIEIAEDDVHIDFGIDSSLFYNDAGWRPGYILEDTIESIFRNNCAAEGAAGNPDNPS